jgi:hypothetical protein
LGGLALFRPTVVLAETRSAEAQNQLVTPNAAAPPLPAPATLQVSARAGRFTLSADRADVQSVLKALFDQAERQFILDSTVTGQVTMRLTNQPLRVALDAICAQTFLRYRYDAEKNLYRFERNDEAIRAAFARLRSLDGNLLQQLRSQGFDIPFEMQQRGVYKIRSDGTVQGGAALNAPNSGSQRAVAPAPRAAGDRKVTPPHSEEAPLRPTPATRQKAGEALQNQAPGSPQDVLARNGRQGEPLSLDADSDKVNPFGYLNNSSPEYNQFLAQNGLVTFTIPKGQAAPVADVLLSLGRQANVPILIDPSVPNGPVFRIDGNLPPRPFVEALNLLAPAARLEWRWVGNQVFVNAAPDFQIFFGSNPVPHVIYRSQSLGPGQRGRQNAYPGATPGTTNQKTALPANPPAKTTEESGKEKK